MNMTAQLQKGFTLITTLIMLLVLTLLVVSAIYVSTINSRIAGNMQAQIEATAAAQMAIEQVISSNFWTIPAAQTINVDIDSDGDNDYAVEVATPTCLSTDPLKASELNSDLVEDRVCLPDTSGTTGVLTSTPSGGGTVWCYKQNWEIEATVDDDLTGAGVVVRQGVFMRVSAGTTC